MAKKVAIKKVKEETLETILFNCRNHLRGRAQMTDKRDLLLTLVFIKFLGDRFNQQRESLKADIANQGIKDEGFIQMQLDSPFSYQKDGVFFLTKDCQWDELIVLNSTNLALAFDNCIMQLETIEVGKDTNGAPVRPLKNALPQQIFTKIVNAWKALREIKEQNEEIAAPLMQVCQSYIQELKHKYESVEIGTYIEEKNDKNVNGEYTLDSVRGVSIQKKMIFTKANMDGVSLKPYKIFCPQDFCFVPITSRNGNKITLSMNYDNENYIVSSSYVVFEIKQKNIILPNFLYLMLSRSEFDRYARFNSWGSAREAFSFEDMKRVRIPLPPLTVQQAIVNIYNCANEAKKIAAEADRMSREVCPALIQHVINNN